MLVVNAGLFIDGNGGEPRRNTRIYVEKGIIIDVVDGQSASVPEGATLLDASAYTVMPGMVEAHTHVVFNGIPDDPTNGQVGLVSDLTGTIALQAYVNAKKDLEAGFTTIRDMLSFEFVDIALRNAINRGLVEGPRISACGYGLTSTGGHMDFTKGLRPDVHLSYFNNIVDTPDQARTTVRFLIKMGVDHIKINCGTCYRVKGRPLIHAPEMRPEVISAIVEEAHTAGRRVAAHCNGTTELKTVQAGVDSLEHAHFIDDETIQAMAEYGTYLVPTMTHCVRNSIDIRKKLPEEKWPTDLVLNAYDSMYRVIPRAFQLGVKIATGTDAGADLVPHGSSATELELLTAIGMSPMQAIVAATRTGAALLDMADMIGTLEKGHFADLLVVKGNPLDDIRLLQNKENIQVVMKNGKVVVDRRN